MKTKITVLALTGSVALVSCARILLVIKGDFAIGAAIAILFPGMFINLFTRGVHGSWDDPVSEALMVGVPAIGWFFLIRAVLRFFYRENEPIQPPVPTRGNGS